MDCLLIGSGNRLERYAARKFKMKRPEVIREWVNEAIETLGKIKPEASGKIVDKILRNLDQPGNRVALLLRKEGKQLEVIEKKRLGLSAKTFFSDEVLNDLTEEGFQSPLQLPKQYGFGRRF